MRKIFLDIGAHNGQTLLLANKRYPNCDMIIGFEPVVSLFEQCVGKVNKLSPEVKKKFVLYNRALDVLDVPEKDIDFYEDLSHGNVKLGSSIYSDKKMKKNRKIQVKCEDVNSFFERTFVDGDSVILKIDIEGKEYDIFESLAEKGNLKYVNKIFAEWHSHKVPSLSKERHYEIVNLLKDMGYEVTGSSKKDEFYAGL